MKAGATNAGLPIVIEAVKTYGDTRTGAPMTGEPTMKVAAAQPAMVSNGGVAIIVGAPTASAFAAGSDIFLV